MLTAPAVAKMLDVWGGVELAVPTAKETEVRPHETLTDAGTLNPAPLVEKPTATPVKGAAAVSEATHVKEAPTTTEVGPQVKELNVCPAATPTKPAIMNTHLVTA
ncbi:MAG: hypothetical protein WBY44_18215 [Bryobacteraceae bacterium]